MGKVIPISTGWTVSEQIADLAFEFWLARRFRGGSPEEDFLRALLEITARRQLNVSQGSGKT